MRAVDVLQTRYVLNKSARTWEEYTVYCKGLIQDMWYVCPAGQKPDINNITSFHASELKDQIETPDVILKDILSNSHEI